MRAIAAASIESGSAPASPSAGVRAQQVDAGTAGCRRSARRRARTTCGGSGASSVTASASASVLGRLERPQLEAHHRRPGGARKPVPVSRRVTTTSHGRSDSPLATAPSRSADAASMRWASLDLEQRRLAQRASTGTARRPRAAARRGTRPPAAPPRRVAGTVDVDGDRDQRQPREQLRVGLATTASAAARATTSSGVVPLDADELAQQLAPGHVRRRRRVGLAGRVQAPQVGGTRRAAPRGGASSRCPVSPTISTSRPAPPRVRFSASCSAASSRWRPTSGKRVGHLLARASYRSRARPATPPPGRRLPLTVNGSSAVSVNRVGERSRTPRVTQIAPGRRLADQSRREVDRVAHDRVLAPIGRSRRRRRTHCRR